MTLTEFLLARITEDETLAQDAICPCGGPACTIELGWYHEDELTQRMTDDGDPGRAVPHILRWSPDRVMAECEAKRRIVERYQHKQASRVKYPNQNNIMSVVVMTEVLQMLAAIYADHPDYDEAWRL